MYYLVKKPSLLKNTIQKLALTYQIIRKPIRKKTITYFDTFDWRLFKKHLTFQQENDAAYLFSLKNQKMLGVSKISPLRTVYHWWEMPAGKLQKQLAAIIDMRVLLPIISCDFRIRTYEILNEDGKIIARLLVNSPTIHRQNKIKRLRRFLEVEAIRGYGAEFHIIKKIVEEQGFIPAERPFLFEIFHAAQIQPGSYSSRIAIQLEPTMSAHLAVKKICRQMLTNIQLNLAGIINDWDSEFLHDFRVAIRRTRSILAQMKMVFPIKRLNYFRQKLGEVQKTTNHLRDLDVYLLRKRNYCTILPPYLRDGLDALFQEITAEREKEYERIKSFLSEPLNLDILKEWESYLQQENLPRRRNSQRPILPFSKKVIRRRLEKVLVKGGRLLKKQPGQEELHKLRIQCKKLRYLLEFFSSLYPEKKIAVLVERLRFLQDLLGEINDFSIQMRDLEKRFEQYQAQPEQRMPLAAIGGLLTYFFQRQRALKQQFQETFQQFSRAEVMTVAKELFY